MPIMYTCSYMDLYPYLSNFIIFCKNFRLSSVFIFLCMNNTILSPPKFEIFGLICFTYTFV